MYATKKKTEIFSGGLYGRPMPRLELGGLAAGFY